MKDTAFKHLTRSALVEIIYQLQLDVQRLETENQALKENLDSKTLLISEAGSIAEATVGLSGIFALAQETADHYLAEVYRTHGAMEAENAAKLADAQAQADAIRSVAEADAARTRQEADRILAEARQEADRTVMQAEQEIEQKWQEINDRVEQLLRTNTTLFDRLG